MDDELLPVVSTGKDKSPSCVVTSFDKGIADLIRLFCIRNKKIPRVSRKAWAPAIAILRRKLEKMGIGERRIFEVWEWYAANYTPGGKLPFVGNGKELADRWNWIVERMEGLAARRPTTAEPASSEARAIMAELGILVWPQGSDEQLPAVVQQSVVNYQSFVEGLTEPMRGAEWISSIIRDVLGECVHYLSQWFHGVWKRHHAWGGWNGDMGPFVWTPQHKTFVDSVSAAICKQTGLPNGSEWQELIASPAKEGKHGHHR